MHALASIVYNTPAAELEHCTGAGFDYQEAWYVAGACLGSINTLFQPPLMQQVRKLSRPLSYPELETLTILQRGLYSRSRAAPRDCLDMLQKRQVLIEQCERFLAAWDAWICPVFPTPAFTHRKPDAPVEVDGKPCPQLLANLLHSVIFNVTGHPVVTIPIGLTAQGLPVGVQVVGRRWQEMTLLNTAGQIASVTSGYQPPF